MARRKKDHDIERRGLPVTEKGLWEELEAAMRYIALEKTAMENEAKKHRLEIKRSETRVKAILSHLDKVRRGETLPFADADHEQEMATNEEDEGTENDPLPHTSVGIPDHRRGKRKS